MQNTRQRGFSLIELLIVTVILLAVVGTVMTYISTAQRRFDSEQTRIDITQESREFMDMMTMAWEMNAKKMGVKGDMMTDAQFKEILMYLKAGG